MISKFKIVFICLANNSRSPAAQAIMEDLIKKKNLKEKIEVDSCGTSDVESGSLPHEKIIEICKKKNIECNHISRKMNKDDLEKNDLIVVMDDNIYNSVIQNGCDKNKIKKMIDFVTDKKGLSSIPDPYKGKDSDFELTVQLIEDGCNGILKSYNFI